MKIRVYYEDTDCGSVVYYANYLRFMERSRTEFLREKGIELDEFHKKGIIFAVTEVQVKYRQPARYNDLLEVESKLIEQSSSMLLFETKIYNQHDILLTVGIAKIVSVSTETGKACKLPEIMMDKLQLYKKQDG